MDWYRPKNKNEKPSRGREAENVDQRSLDSPRYVSTTGGASDHPAQRLFVSQHFLFLAKLLIPRAACVWRHGLVLSPTIHPGHWLLVCRLEVAGVVTTGGMWGVARPTQRVFCPRLENQLKSLPVARNVIVKLWIGGLGSYNRLVNDVSNPICE